MDAGYEFVAELPTFDEVKAGFCHARKQFRWSVYDPQTVEVLEIPADLVALRDGTSFIVLDATVEKKSRIMIFASLSDISALKKYSEFFVDETFKTCCKPILTIVHVSRAQCFTHCFRSFVR